MFWKGTPQRTDDGVCNARNIWFCLISPQPLCWIRYHNAFLGTSGVCFQNVFFDSRSVRAKYVITCGGLHSDHLAKFSGCSSNPKIVPFRGEYLKLKDGLSDLVHTNIYPVSRGTDHGSPPFRLLNGMYKNFIWLRLHTTGEITYLKKICSKCVSSFFR